MSFCGLAYWALVTFFEHGIVFIGGFLLAIAIIGQLVAGEGTALARFGGKRWIFVLVVVLAVGSNAMPIYLYHRALEQRQAYWLAAHKFVEIGIMFLGGIGAICSVPCAYASGPWPKGVRLGSWVFLAFGILGVAILAGLLLQTRGNVTDAGCISSLLMVW